MNDPNFWNELTDEEKLIAMEAVANSQAVRAEALKREKIETLKDKVYDDLRTLDDLMDVSEFCDFFVDLSDNFCM